MILMLFIMKRKIKNLLFILFFVVVYPVSIKAEDNTNAKFDTEQVVNDLNQKKSKIITQIDTLLTEIDQLIAAGCYEKAVQKFESVKQKSKQLGNSEYAKVKKAFIDRKEEEFYKIWSQNLESKANAAYINKEWEDSIKLAQKSIDILNKTENPNSGITKSQKLIITKSANQLIHRDYKNNASEIASLSEYQKNKKNIDIALAQARTYIKNKQYVEARDILEKILVSDQYNSEAIFLLNDVYKKMFITSKRRNDVSMRDKMDQVEWVKNEPYRDDKSTSLTVVRSEQSSVPQEENTNLRKKLQNIIIPKAEFDNASISSVITYIIKESKNLDTKDHAGINIVLKLEDNPTQEPVKITMSMDHMPAGELIKYVCIYSGLQYRVEEDAVIIGSNIDALETKHISLKSDIINSLVSSLKINTSTISTKTGFYEPTEFSTKGAAQLQTTSPASQLNSAVLKGYFSMRGILFPTGSQIAWDVRTNTLIVTNTHDNIKALENLLLELDTQLPLVLIEAKFVEVREEDLKELGLKWKQYLQSQGGGPEWGINVFNPSYVTGTTLPAAQTTTQNGNDAIMRQYNSGNIGKLINDYSVPINNFVGKAIGNFDFWLYALDQCTMTEVLSAPKVVTKSGTPAVINVVEENYYPTSWSAPTVSVTDNTVTVNLSKPTFAEPTDLGIRLNVIPTVSSNNYTILLDLRPQVVAFDGWSDYRYHIKWQQGTSTTPNDTLIPVKMPKILHKDVTTKVRIFDGETVVVGGIITDDTVTTDDQVPILGNIPLIGRLFRSQYKESTKKNLLIFVTAKLVNPDGSTVRKILNENGLPNFKPI